MENNMLSSKNINLDVNNSSSNENSPKNTIYKNLRIEINNINYSPQYSNQLNAFFEQFSGK
jgi:hypothetical protein